MAKNKNTGDENLAKVEGALNKSEQFIENNEEGKKRGELERGGAGKREEEDRNGKRHRNGDTTDTQFTVGRTKF